MPKKLFTQVALASMCLVGAIGAHAAVPTATQLVEASDGIGHMLIVPYYTVQAGNATLLNITNSDRVNGKAVKVRFRGASNADDVFNFTLFLAPGDVWAAEISQNPATGLARLSTPDESCTLPTNVNRDFNTARLNPATNVANESREGYIDIITMADVVPGTALYTATTAVAATGKPPAACSQGAATPAALQALLTEAGINAAGFGVPTTGLFANWSIFNVPEATSWAGAATAIAAVDSQGIAGAGKVVVFPQATGTPAGAINELTSDPLLRSGTVAAQRHDLPDLSTPYVGSSTTTQQAAILSGALAKTSVRNEYFSDDRVQAQTDWVFSLPTRRYSVALNYGTGLREFTELPTAYFNEASTTLMQDGAPNTLKVCVPFPGYIFTDRMGKSRTRDQIIDDLWDVPVRQIAIAYCGAVVVWSLQAGDEFYSSALSAAVTRDNVDSTSIFPADGWVEVQNPGVNNEGVPLIGAAFAKATSTNIGAGVSGNFGLTWPHRFTRPGNVVH
jgi:hypothetical protein